MIKCETCVAGIIWKPTNCPKCIGVKPDFDITKHEWSDDPIKYLDNDASGVELRATDSAWFVNFYLDKSDSIALAKYFKLTPEDLT